MQGAWPRRRTRKSNLSTLEYLLPCIRNITAPAGTQAGFAGVLPPTSEAAAGTFSSSDARPQTTISHTDVLRDREIAVLQRRIDEFELLAHSASDPSPHSQAIPLPAHSSVLQVGVAASGDGDLEATSIAENASIRFAFD